MKIGIDARVIGKYPGLGRTCLQLIRELSDIDKENKYIIFGNHPSLRFLEDCENFRIVDIHFPVLSLKTLFWLGHIIKREYVDLFHSPFQVTPVFLPCPMTVTIHDMMDLFYPDAFRHHPFYVNYGLRIYFRFAIPRSIRNSKKIIAVSLSTKKDILKFIKVPGEKIEVIHNGVEDKFAPVNDMSLKDKVRERYNLPHRFILYLGSTKPYKNLDNVIQSFERFTKMGTELSDVYMVIAGMRHFESSKLDKKAKALGIDKRLKVIGHVDEDDLSVVYSLAEIFLFPSIWEGFGLPALEAMACGVPVITSNTSSLPEVVGDAGIQVDPYDVDKIVRAIKRVLADATLRKDMIKKGLERAKLFSWKSNAEKTLRIFEEVVRIDF